MISRKIQAPGVEVNEIDLSQYGNLNLEDNTVVLINGFSDKGDNNTVKIVTSIPDFTTEYGYPTTEAERYLYNAVKQTLLYGGIPAISKIPYQNNSLSTYSACRYIVDGSQKLDPLCNYLSNIEELFPSGQPIPENDYNLSSLMSFLESVENLSSFQEISELSDVQILIAEIQEINEKLGIGEHELNSVQEISANLLEINEKLQGNEKLDYSTQVELFGKFINGICNFESYGLQLSVYEEIQNLLFDTRFCMANILDIYENADTLSTLNENDPKSVIFFALMKNGYSNFDLFKENFTKTFTKSDFLQCAHDVEGTYLSVDPEEVAVISALKYTDLARIEGMKSFTSISADNDFPGFISFDQYDDFSIGEKNILPDGSITIVDITRSKYEKDKLIQNEYLSSAEYIGIVPVLVSPVNAMYYQNLLEQNVESIIEYNIVSDLSTARGLSTIVEDFEIPLSSDSNHGTSLGRVAESYFPKIDYFTPTRLDNTMLHKIGVVVFKMLIDTANNNKISFTPVEAFFGSLNRKDKDLTTNTTDFLEDIVNNQSQYINMFIKMSDSKIGQILKNSTILISNQPAYSLGFSSEDCVKNISVKLIESSLRLAFDHLQSPNTLKIDVVADAGMSNIAQYIANTTFENMGKFEIADNYNFPIVNSNSVKIWKNIVDLYDDFCKNTRKDCMFIADSPRNFCLVGNQKMVRRSNPENTIENTVLPSLRFMVDFDTSYGAGYSNWFRCIDDTLRYYMWMPPSIKVIEAYLVTDNMYNFWDAPAGLRRGIMNDTYDIAFNPSEKDAEKLYVNRWNYAVSYPLEGIIIEGQKTFQKNRTAFDRVNVRRLFLRIEKDIRMMARSFLYEPLTARNLQKFNDMVNTYLQDIKTKGGIREFYVICDGRNNTNETIDNNEMHCSIGVMPVKTTEYIVLRFICTNQSANVEEVTSQNI